MGNPTKVHSAARLSSERKAALRHRTPAFPRRASANRFLQRQRLLIDAALCRYPVDLYARAADGSGDGSQSVALIQHGPDPLMVEPALTARLGPSAFGPLNAIALALLEEPALHMGHHAEHGRNEVAHLTPGAHQEVEHSQERTLLLNPRARG